MELLIFQYSYNYITTVLANHIDYLTLHGLYYNFSQNKPSLVDYVAEYTMHFFIVIIQMIANCTSGFG